MQRLWRRTTSKSTTSRGLAWFSIGLGLAEVVAGRRLARKLGIEEKTNLVRLFGVRDIVTGVGILAGRRTGPWLGMRVLGDVLDLGVLGWALSPRNRKRDNAAIALASVLGMTLLDVVSGATSE